MRKLYGVELWSVDLRPRRPRGEGPWQAKGFVAGASALPWQENCSQLPRQSREGDQGVSVSCLAPGKEEDTDPALLPPCDAACGPRCARVDPGARALRHDT